MRLTKTHLKITYVKEEDSKVVVDEVVDKTIDFKDFMRDYKENGKDIEIIEVDKAPQRFQVGKIYIRKDKKFIWIYQPRV